MEITFPQSVEVPADLFRPPFNDSLKPPVKLFLSILYRDKGPDGAIYINYAAFCAWFGVSDRTVDNWVRTLTKLGHIEKMGSGVYSRQYRVKWQPITDGGGNYG